jgi:hypothetical protein
MNSTKRNTDNSVSFFLVGCWNRGVVHEQGLVFDKIIEKQDDMDMLLILGDNVYTDGNSFFPADSTYKSTNSKIHSLNVYNRGVERIFKSSDGTTLSKPVYFVLGNHDVSTRQKDCEIYKAQTTKEFTKFPYRAETIVKGNTRVKLICIDTNFVDLELDYSKKSCINNSSKLALRNQLEWLGNEISRSSEDYILVMGHHPMVYNKMKGDDPKQDFIYELIELFGAYPEKSITYICADNHMYQDWTITYPSGNSVDQIVCGTGGAKLDQGGNPNREFERNGIKFYRDNEISNVNGFCQIVFNKEQKIVRFYDVYRH